MFAAKAREVSVREKPNGMLKPYLGPVLKETARAELGVATTVWVIASLSNLYSQYNISGSITDPASCFWSTEIAETMLLLASLAAILTFIILRCAFQDLHANEISNKMEQDKKSDEEKMLQTPKLLTLFQAGLYGAFFGWMVGSCLNFYSANTVADAWTGRAINSADFCKGPEVARDALIGAVLFMVIASIHYWKVHKNQNSEAISAQTTQVRNEIISWEDTNLNQ